MNPTPSASANTERWQTGKPGNIMRRPWNNVAPSGVSVHQGPSSAASLLSFLLYVQLGFCYVISMPCRSFCFCAITNMVRQGTACLANLLGALLPSGPPVLKLLPCTPPSHMREQLELRLSSRRLLLTLRLQECDINMTCTHSAPPQAAAIHTYIHTYMQDFNVHGANRTHGTENEVQ
jgi:hypothetical protein